MIESATENLPLDIKPSPEASIHAIDRHAPTVDTAQTMIEEKTMFYDSSWLAAWRDSFLPGKGWSGPVEVHKAIHDGVELGHLAFAWQSLSVLKIRSLAGFYWPFRTAVLNQPEHASMFATTLSAQFARKAPGAVLRLGPISLADKVIATLISNLTGHGWKALHRKTGAAFALNLPESFRTLESTVSKSLLKNIDYLRRRLTKEQGPIDIERHVLNAESSDLLKTLSTLERRTWVAEHGGDLKFVGDQNEKFWATLGQAEGRRSKAVVWLLRCNQQAVAFSAHIETADTMYIIANGYDEQWKQFSPGSILTHRIFSESCGRIRRVDWGQGDSGYKQRWGAKPDAALADVMLFRPGIVGGLMYLAAQRVLRSWSLGQPDEN